MVPLIKVEQMLQKMTGVIGWPAENLFDGWRNAAMPKFESYLNTSPPKPAKAALCGDPVIRWTGQAKPAQSKAF